MDILYLINYGILAAFLSLLIIETGVGMLSVMDIARYRDSVKKYILPIWGVEGTFGVFYVINSIATYPGIVAIAAAYMIPILLAALFFLIRTVFIAYSEFIFDIKEEHKFRQVYGLSTIFVSFILVAIFCSALSGIGVDASVPSISTVTVLFNPFNILVFVSVALIALFTASVFFHVKSVTRPSYIFLPLSMVIFIAAVYLYVPSIYASIQSYYHLLGASVLIMIGVIVLDISGSRYTKHAALLWIFASIMMFGVVQYPYLLGGSATYTSFMTNSASAAAIALITLAGGTLLTIALLLFVYINYVKK